LILISLLLQDSLSISLCLPISLCRPNFTCQPNFTLSSQSQVSSRNHQHRHNTSTAHHIDNRSSRHPYTVTTDSRCSNDQNTRNARQEEVWSTQNYFFTQLFENSKLSSRLSWIRWVWKCGLWFLKIQRVGHLWLGNLKGLLHADVQRIANRATTQNISQTLQQISLRIFSNLVT
jgi:hypothetical protein